MGGITKKIFVQTLNRSHVELTVQMVFLANVTEVKFEDLKLVTLHPVKLLDACLIMLSHHNWLLHGKRTYRHDGLRSKFISKPPQLETKARYLASD